MKSKVIESERRRFLAGMVAAGGAAAVVALSPGEESSAAQSAESGSQAREPAARGYQRTAHVDAYYRTLRS